MLEVLDLLERTKLNWSVNREALTTIDGLKTESFGLFRNDTDQWLGTVGNRYAVYQNASMAEVIVKASRNMIDAENIRGGSLKGGKKIFLQIPLEDVAIESDTVKRLITALNSHDGSTAIGFGSSNTVVSCDNTFHRVYKDLQKFRHTESAEAQVEKAGQQLVEAILKDSTMMEGYKRMTEHKVDLKLFGDIVGKLFKVDLNEDKKDVSTRKLNVVKDFKNAIESEMGEKGETLWGLFNGVTYFTNHIEVKNKKLSERKEHLMLGGGYRKNLITFNEIMKFMEAKTKTTVLI